MDFYVVEKHGRYMPRHARTGFVDDPRNAWRLPTREQADRLAELVGGQSLRIQGSEVCTLVEIREDDRTRDPFAEEASPQRARLVTGGPVGNKAP